MRKPPLVLLVFVTVAGIGRADLISYLVTANASAEANGNQFSFASSLEIPAFDPLLGTLNSIDFSLLPDGRIIWDVASISNNSNFKPWYLVGGTTFMDMESPASTRELLGPGVCIPNDGAPCGQTYQSTSYLGAYLTMKGTLTEDQQSFTGWNQGPYSLGTRPGGFSDFMGPAPIQLPVSTEVIVDHSSWVVATPRSLQNINWNLAWKYNYTPAPAVSAVPEPRWSAVLLVAGLVIASARKRRSAAESNPERKVPSGTFPL